MSCTVNVISRKDAELDEIRKSGSTMDFETQEDSSVYGKRAFVEEEICREPPKYHLFYFYLFIYFRVVFQ